VSGSGTQTIDSANGRVQIIPLVPAGEAATERDHRLLGEGLKDGVEIRELGSSGSVPVLEVVNDLGIKILGIEGEVLQGCKQNRILNTSLMVDAKSTVKVPVSCVQRGRWSFRSGKMAPPEHMAPRRVRHAAKKAAFAAAAAGLGYQADQGEIWGEVDAVHAEYGACTPTADLAEAAELHEQRAEVGALRARIEEGLRGAVGYALAIDGRWEAVELLGEPTDFELLRPNYARALAAEVARVPSRPAADTRPAEPREALALVTDLVERNGAAFSGVALGEELRAESPESDWSLSALVEDGSLRVLSALWHDRGRGGARAPRPREHQREPRYRVETHSGRIVVSIDGQRVLFDTALDRSFGSGRPLSILEREIPLPAQPDLVRWIGLRLRQRIDAVLGGDHLRTLPFAIDWRAREVRLLSEAEPPHRWYADLDPQRRVPAIRLPGGVSAVLDTGSSLSYAPREAIQGHEPLYVTTEFHPLEGEFFVTPVYRVPIEIAGHHLRLRVGVLPDDLRARLRLAPTDWVIGTDAMRRARVRFYRDRVTFDWRNERRRRRET
jgi:hypothetical protein